MWSFCEAVKLCVETDRSNQWCCIYGTRGRPRRIVPAAFLTGIGTINDNPIEAIRAPEGIPGSRFRLRDYQWPVFGMLAHGSAAGSDLPFCSSSIEMLSGDLTNAIWPSRGGRLISIPFSIN